MADLIHEYAQLGGAPPASGRFRTKAEGEAKIAALRAAKPLQDAAQDVITAAHSMTPTRSAKEPSDSAPSGFKTAEAVPWPTPTLTFGPEEDPTAGPTPEESAAAHVRRILAERARKGTPGPDPHLIELCRRAAQRAAFSSPVGLARLWTALCRRPRLKDHPGLGKKARRILRRNIRQGRRERRRRAKLQKAIGRLSALKNVRITVHSSGSVTAEGR